MNFSRMASSGKVTLLAASMLSMIGIAGCKSASPTPIVQTVELKQPPNKPALPLPAPISLQPVTFIVVTPATVPVGDDWTLVALSPKQYEALTRNDAEIIRWMKEAMFQLLYYRETEKKP